MAFKFVLPLCAVLLAVANAGYVAPVTYAAAPVLTKVVNPSVDAVASTQHNVVRSFGGTVSHYSKSVDTPYSSVRKVDTRINNNVYTPAVAKTVSYTAPAVYAAPAFAKTVSYAAPTVYAAPAFAKTVSYAAPAVTYSAAPAVHTYAASAPAVYSHAASVPVVNHAIAYSPAATVSHASFDGFGTHWGY